MKTGMRKARNSECEFRIDEFHQRVLIDRLDLIIPFERSFFLLSLLVSLQVKQFYEDLFTRW